MGKSVVRVDPEFAANFLTALPECVSVGKSALTESGYLDVPISGECVPDTAAVTMICTALFENDQVTTIGIRFEPYTGAD